MNIQNREENFKVSTTIKGSINMNTYQICHNWKHRQGHIVTSKWNPLISATNEEEAIIKFKETNPELGQYFKNDLKEHYWYYGSRSQFSIKEDHWIYAVKL